MRVILLGPPGAGKGTQARHISRRFGIPHISTGDIFMKNITGETELGKKAKEYLDKGSLVPDEITIDLVRNRIREEDAKNGYLLDGFPRNLNQGEVLCKISEDMGEGLDAALLIDVPFEDIKERMEGRRICTSCGASYHIKFNPPEEEGVCNKCGHKLAQRRDDHDEAVEERLKVYEEYTKPLIGFFRKKNLLVSVDGTKGIDEVTKTILDVLTEMDKKHNNEESMSEVNGH